MTQNWSFAKITDILYLKITISTKSQMSIPFCQTMPNDFLLLVRLQALKILHTGDTDLLTDADSSTNTIFLWRSTRKFWGWGPTFFLVHNYILWRDVKRFFGQGMGRCPLPEPKKVGTNLFPCKQIFNLALTSFISSYKI